ncbi:MAG: hypothetical protein ACXAD7_17115 [Candidatus Kariarchaeaceae archaeon]|jgi:hypothetical protein
MEYIWISIQSDFGITMGELGRLSADTDSKLIASTLMALKDIVSVEASSGESQFMTGAVETSSFGTFAIVIDEQSKLIMSYIISPEAGSTVDDATVNLVQSLCNNFGKQLIQFGNISFLATSGAAMPRDILIKAFLNACVIVRMENNLPSDARALGKGYQEVLKEFFDDPNVMNEVINYILDGDDWKKNNDLWLDGFLSSQNRERLIVGFANHIVFSLANKNPSLFMYSPSPRSEPKRIYQRLKKELRDRVKTPYKQITQALPKEMEGKVEKFLERIPLVDLHTSEDTLYNQFVRSALLKSMKKDPLVIFAPPDREAIQKKFMKLLPEVSLENAGTVLLRALKPALHESAYHQVELFFNQFINEMSGISLSQTAMDLLMAFSQQFIPGKEIKENLSTLEDVPKRWIRDLSKFVSAREIKQLKIDSIDEGMILTNAASSAVASTLAKAIADQFLFVEGKAGEVLDEMTSFYLTSGPTIKVCSILVTLLHSLSEAKFDVELITPFYIDFLTAAAMKKHLQFGLEEKFSAIKRKKGELSVNVEDADMTFANFANVHNSAKLRISSDNIIPVKFNEFNENIFLSLIDDPELIVDAIVFATERRLHNELIGSYDRWIADISQEFDNLISFFSQPKVLVSEAMARKPKLPAHRLLGLRLGKEVDEFVPKMVEEANGIWENMLKEWTSISNEIKQKNEVHKKTPKKVEKIGQNIHKALIGNRPKFVKFSDRIIKEVHKDVKPMKNEFKKVMRPEEAEILSFKYTDGDLLPKKEEVLGVVGSLAETIDSLRAGELERLILSVSLALFENPPESILEYAYNEIITGKMSKAIRSALNKVKTKKEFEYYFKEQGQNYANSVYEGLTKLIDRVNKIYINKDGIISSDAGRITLQVGRVPLKKYPRQKLIDELLSFPNITYTRETANWLVSFDFSELKGFKSEEPTIVTFSDAVKYVHRASFNNRMGNTFEGLSTVASLIERKAGNRLKDTLNSLSDAIFDLSD